MVGLKQYSLVLAEQEKFVETAKDNWYKEIFYVMFHTGLRVGEVGGLKWVGMI